MVSALRIARSLAVAAVLFAAVPAFAGGSESGSPSFEEPAAPPHAAFGRLQLDRDLLSRSARSARKPRVALELPLGATWTASAGSMAWLADRVRAPAFRGETSILVPLGNRLGLRTTLVETYDGAAGKSNTVVGLVGVALQF
jgi:hypothetical protein